MDKGLMELVMNPVRQRIIQCVALKGTVTTGQLQEELTDVPKASLYRHVKLLHEGGLLEVVSETKVRGTIQREYRLAKTPLNVNAPDENSAAVYNVLMSLLNSFRRYFGSAGSDMMADRLFVTSKSLLLTDEEFELLLTQMDKLIDEVKNNLPADGRKPRRLSVISSPYEE